MHHHVHQDRRGARPRGERLTPASSITGLTSTAVYFAAALLLMVLLMGPGVSLYGQASKNDAADLAQAIAHEVDALVPGMTAQVDFESPVAGSSQVALSGHVVTATVDGFSSNATVSLALPDDRLLPGVQYALSVSDGVVSIV